MKIILNSDGDLLLNKQLTMTIVVKSVFEEDGKFYPQICLDEWLYEL